jgi:hypothetical protein
MKILITERQYINIKLDPDCENKVSFEYVTAIRNNHGRRTVCVDDVFYKLIREYQDNKFDDNYMMSEGLERLIYEYYYETYYMDSNFLTIKFITGNDIPIVSVRYAPNYNKNT